MKLSMAFVIATLSGFIALSYEILWVRAYGFATEGEPDSFPLLLSAYLGGLALGSLISRHYCERADSSATQGREAAASRPLRSQALFLVGFFLVAGNVAAFLLIPLVAHLVSAFEVKPEATLVCFGAVAACLGIGFPLLAHFAIEPDGRAGSRLSYLYVGNIAGSTLGSLMTGLWLLDVLSLRQLSLDLAIAGVALGALLMFLQTEGGQFRAIIALSFSFAVMVMAGTSTALFDGVYEKLLYQDYYYPGRRFAFTYEGRSGVVNLSKSGTVYGGGSYDGQLNVSPLPTDDDNRVRRAYLVAAVHAAPRDILMIGLGSGSWLQVLANYPDVERLTVVEINEGYIEMMRRSPLVASAVDHPKVEIVIDDGRRYLSRSTEQWDIIIQNTIVHYRGHASNLLSREYLELSKRRLKEGGILYFNSTMSAAAQKTGATVFPNAIRYENMMLCSEQPIEWSMERFEQGLDSWRIDGESVLPSSVSAASLRLFDEREWRGGTTWELRDAILKRTEGEPIITDDNMATEWWASNTFP